jgi:hypothetical protein
LPSNVELSIWNPEKGPPPSAALAEADAVVNLMGEPVAQRWSPEVRQRIRNSRVEGTRRLVEGLAMMARKPSVLVSASAVGFYGNRGDEVLTETSMPGSGFLTDVCLEWEKSALEAAGLGVRVAVVRVGFVLGKGGGALAKMVPPFKAGLGGKLGSGAQWTPWIHLDDLCAMFQWAVENPKARGPLNGTGPNPLKNIDFTRTLGQVLRRPAILPIPEFAIRLLYGEMGEILFHSQRAIPKTAQAGGFEFRHPELLGALKDLLG